MKCMMCLGYNLRRLLTVNRQRFFSVDCVFACVMLVRSKRGGMKGVRGFQCTL
jgi:hypothetical protein